MNFTEHKAMIEALKAGAATPAQQRAVVEHLQTVQRRHAQELRESERDAKDAYDEGRANERSASRGEHFGTF